MNAAVENVNQAKESFNRVLDNKKYAGLLIISLSHGIAFTCFHIVDCVDCYNVSITKEIWGVNPVIF